MNAFAGVLLGLCCAAVIACGGAMKGARPQAAPTPVRASGERGENERVQIRALDREITDAMARAQLPPIESSCSGAACAEAMSTPFVTPSQQDPQCRPANNPKCTDTCSLAGSICTNQQKICDLAQQLDGDEWAAGKCDSARASCKAAHEKCCGCVL
jgi:hypothetical protein